MTYRRSMRVVVLTALFALPVATWADSIRLPKTGQTSSSATGDDGAVQAGKSWPTPRFVKTGKGTVTDKLTGLVWLEDAGCIGAKTWTDALTAANTLASGACGLSDKSIAGQWRLPNAREMKSLVNLQQLTNTAWLNLVAFKNVQMNWYWSSTTYSENSAAAWRVNLDGAGLGPDWKTNSYPVWPVRGGGAGSGVVQLPKTGQTVSYAAGDDGALEQGAIWPFPRFIDYGNGTVLDGLTGLVWLKNLKCTDTVGGIDKSGGFLTWRGSLTWSNALADGDCGLSDGSKPGDWRMPNLEEQYSLIDPSHSNPALPAGITAASSLLWTSSTDASLKIDAFCVNAASGAVSSNIKTGNLTRVWPVRNAPPTISGVPPAAGVVGAPYSFVPASTYADSFSSTGPLPPGVAFDASTGALSGIPTFVGVYENIVITASNAGGSASLSPFTITVTGQPPAIGVSPASLNLGSVGLGASSVEKLVTLRNIGQNPLLIEGVRIVGADFSPNNKGCGYIPQNGICLVGVTFTPSSLPYGKKTATLVIDSNASNRPVVNVKLTGQLTPPKIVVTPAALNFGKLASDVASAMKTVTVRNSGSSDLAITSVSVTGADFTAKNSCGTLPRGESCTIDVTFAPSVRGVRRSATLEISSNDPKTPKVMRLSGSAK